MDRFNFDAWATLARTAPDKFEQQRREMVDALISDSTNTRRLQGLQSRIELERMRAHTPLKSCLRLSTLMWDAFLDCRDALNAFSEQHAESARAESQSSGSAKIVAFPKKYKPHD
jgi:hypothetical protein